MKSPNNKYHYLTGGILSILTLFISFSCHNITKYNSPETARLTDTVPEKSIRKPVLTFGIPSDSFRIITNRIKPNRFLSDILGEYGISRHETDELIRNSSKVFDVRDIRAGHTYTILTDLFPRDCSS